MTYTINRLTVPELDADQAKETCRKWLKKWALTNKRSLTPKQFLDSYFAVDVSGGLGNSPVRFKDDIDVLRPATETENFQFSVSMENSKNGDTYHKNVFKFIRGLNDYLHITNKFVSRSNGYLTVFNGLRILDGTDDDTDDRIMGVFTCYPDVLFYELLYNGCNASTDSDYTACKIEELNSNLVTILSEYTYNVLVDVISGETFFFNHHVPRHTVLFGSVRVARTPWSPRDAHYGKSTHEDILNETRGVSSLYGKYGIRQQSSKSDLDHYDTSILDLGLVRSLLYNMILDGELFEKIDRKAKPAKQHRRPRISKGTEPYFEPSVMQRFIECEPIHEECVVELDSAFRDLAVRQGLPVNWFTGYTSKSIWAITSTILSTRLASRFEALVHLISIVDAVHPEQLQAVEVGDGKVAIDLSKVLTLKDNCNMGEIERLERHFINDFNTMKKGILPIIGDTNAIVDYYLGGFRETS